MSFRLWTPKHLIATFSWITHHVTKLTLSCFNMMNSSLCTTLHGQLISILRETLGMRWNKIFSLWISRWQMCSNRVMSSCQYEPKSWTKLPYTLVNICHKHLRAVVKAKWIPTLYHLDAKIGLWLYSTIQKSWGQFQCFIFAKTKSAFHVKHCCGLVLLANLPWD